MSASIYSGLSCARAGDALEVRYPARIHSAARAAAVAGAHGLEIGAGAGDAWQLRAPAEALKAFFADLNGFRAPYPAQPLGDGGAAPLMSCVIVVNENVPFVREQLVPSLRANSPRHPIEIVLVYNGSAREDPALGALRSVRSGWSAVAAAYNAGARAARGEYLALFHDDCVMDDPLWMDKCIGALEGGAGAVAGEFRRMDSIAGTAVPPLSVAKCVPLVMRKQAYFAAGGFDEFHYVGYEDLDFTLALAQRGMKVAAADLRLRHFGGMSSTLKYCAVPGLAALYAMTALPAGAIRQRFSEFARTGLHLDGIDYLRMALDVQLFYVLKKYRDFLAHTDPQAYALALAALERGITKECPFDATLILPRFKDLDRRLDRVAAA